MRIMISKGMVSKGQYSKFGTVKYSPVLIFSCPKGLTRVTQYSILCKKCQNTLIARVLDKGL